MKALWVCCNESVSEDVQEAVERGGASGYTLWTDVRGAHVGCKRHWGDAVFPGLNHVYWIVDEDVVIDALCLAIRNLKADPAVRHAGIKAFVERVEEAF